MGTGTGMTVKIRVRGTTAVSAVDASVEAPATPAAFVRQLERFFATEGAAAASRYFDQCGATMAPRLTGKLDTRVEEIMHIVDTISGWTPPPDARGVVIVSDEFDVNDEAEDTARPLASATSTSD